MSAFPPYGPPPPDVPVSKRFSDDSEKATALVAAVSARLDEGERLLCLLAVAKIQPSLDVLAVTGLRVVAGWRDNLDDANRDWPVQIPIQAVVGIEVTGFMDNVKFVLANGDGIKVGNLWDAADEETLRACVRSARSEEADPEGPPTYELYPRADPGQD